MTVQDPSSAFQAFGRLYAHVITLEQFMRVALAEHEVRSGRYAKLNEAKQDAYSRKMMGLNFGQLLDRVAGAFKLGEIERTVLNDAKGFRHHLAHEFWVNNLVGLHTEQGVSLLAEECEALELQFKLVTELVIAATGLNAKQYVEWTQSRARDPAWFQEKRRLLDDVWGAHRHAGHV